jgi:hypothetical protein
MGNFDAKCVYRGEIRGMAAKLLMVWGSFGELTDNDTLFSERTTRRLSENSKIVVFNDWIVTGGETPPLP